MSPVVKTNPDTGLPYETPKNDPSESDDLLNDLANSADDKEMSPSEIDENTDKLDDIANSLEDDSDDFDFFLFLDADDELLSNALAIFVQLINSHPEIKCFSSNYYIKFNKTDKKFFKINSSDYKKVNNINYNYINIDEEFKKLINLE